ncbi:MAG: AbrB/MazE/SpoVT family DNA-binding domain-containing protein [Alphaproteobacteria bacterium]|nr:MAG: AbrB/MazE/SpoVT family DNA-binding domain-containing protein [Alphaproteobacteria bacterium]
MVTTRTFKSGNSVALRLPKALGIEEGVEMRVREEQGRYIVEPVDRPKRKFNIAKVAGSARNLQLIKDEDRLFDERPLLWEKLAEAERGVDGKSKN